MSYRLSLVVLRTELQRLRASPMRISVGFRRETYIDRRRTAAVNSMPPEKGCASTDVYCTITLFKVSDRVLQYLSPY